MSSVWRSLLWKEWREHRGMLSAILAVGAVVPVLLSIKSPDSIFGAATATLVMLVPLSAMFVGMHVAASEQSRRTIRFLQALPTPMAKPAMAKLCWAALTIVASVAAAVGAAGVWNWLAGGSGPADDVGIVHRLFGYAWGIEGWYAGVLVSGGLAGLSVMIWMAAAGVNQSDEVRAGAVGILVVLACWAALTLPVTHYAKLATDAETWPRWSRIASAAAPGGPSGVVGRRPIERVELEFAKSSWVGYFWPIIAAAVLSHGALATWYVVRFGRMSSRQQAVEGPSVTRDATRQWLCPPRRGPVAAIAWKQLRETAPLALLGAGAVVIGALWSAYYNRASESIAFDTLAASVAVWLATGMFVAIVAGVGVFMDDLKPGLHTFWRSRPIPLLIWFAVKYVLALSSTLVILAIPALVVLAMLWGKLAGSSIDRDDVFVVAAAGPLLQAALFTVAVAAMTLVRQPIYAAILTVAVMLATWAAVSTIASSWPVDREAALIVLTCGTLSISALALTWLALRNDWGWKG